MKKLIRYIPLMILMQLLLVGCMHFEPMHSGTIIDAETKNPLGNAVAIIDISYGCVGYSLISPSVGSDELDSYDALTDNEGRYRLPFKAYFLPPFLCLTDKYFTYSKVGYFTERKDTNHGEVYLHRMKRFLNYLPYTDKYMLSSEKSQYLKTEIMKFNINDLVPKGDIGVFLRLPGKAITRIYRRMTSNIELYYVYDSISNSWTAFDTHGNEIEIQRNELPHWDYIATNSRWGYPLYASKDSIFFPLDETPHPISYRHNKGEIKSITAKIGDISALVGTDLDSFTFEGNGKAMCNYGLNYGEESINKKENSDNPHLKQCYTSANLPHSTQDNTTESSIFEFVSDTLNHGMFIVTKSLRYWHIYTFGYTDEPKRKFTEIYTLPIEKEMTAFIATGNSFYIALKNDGLKKYDIFGSTVKEDINFANNARMTRGLNITSLITGSATNVFALYATTGEDKIYSFSTEGIPDYIINVNSNSN